MIGWGCGHVWVPGEGIVGATVGLWGWLMGVLQWVARGSLGDLGSLSRLAGSTAAMTQRDEAMLTGQPFHLHKRDAQHVLLLTAPPMTHALHHRCPRAWTAVRGCACVGRATRGGVGASPATSTSTSPSRTTRSCGATAPRSTRMWRSATWTPSWAHRCAGRGDLRGRVQTV